MGLHAIGLQYPNERSVNLQICPQELDPNCNEIVRREVIFGDDESPLVEVDAQKIRCPVYVLGFDLKKIGLDYPVDLIVHTKPMHQKFIALGSSLAKDIVKNGLALYK